MAGARPLDTLRLTTGIAIGTLLLSGAILLAPAIRDCSDGEGSLAGCLRDKLIDRQLLPQPGLPVLDATVPDLPAPAPSVEVAPEPGSLTTTVPVFEAGPPVAAGLTAESLELAAVAAPQPDVAGTAVLNAAGGTVSVNLPYAAPAEEVATLSASGANLSATSGFPATPEDIIIPLDAPAGSLATNDSGGDIDPVITADLATSQVAISGTNSVPQARPPLLTAFGETAGTMSASASTAADNHTALATLTPLETPEPPPLPRPREDDPPPVVDPPPTPEPAPPPPPVPQPEPVPPPLVNDPDFPSVTVLPPPATGENSSIITLTLTP